MYFKELENEPEISEQQIICSAFLVGFRELKPDNDH